MIVKRLGCVPYLETFEAMKLFTASRRKDQEDELWVLEHPPVYTVGMAGKQEHLPREDNHIPVVRIDRGGQITYHGPGQVIVYLLLDLRRRTIKIRELVRLMEQAVINLLKRYAIHGEAREDAPGVYVEHAKIAALGLRIQNGCSYHGLSFNVKMDLSPFHVINPCGYAGLKTIQLSDFIPDCNVEDVSHALLDELVQLLKPTEISQS